MSSTADAQRPGFIPPRKKLSIYDDQPEPALAQPEPSRLELAIRQAQVQVAVDKWIDVEHKATATIKRYAAPGETLLPNALYVTVAGFAGSILTKNRSFPLRILGPTGLSLGAFTYLYPRTTHNIYKQTVAPQVEGTTVLDVAPKAASPFNNLVDQVKGLLGAGGGTEGTEVKKEVK
ncbi:hypothetical protein HDV00_005305 [Rhizophlyctis rosea]|nr:hypothetical protein HDV00_005305 [Rhizophlyctis rosea]